jgi:hypothetical protein
MCRSDGERFLLNDIKVRRHLDIIPRRIILTLCHESNAIFLLFEVTFLQVILTLFVINVTRGEKEFNERHLKKSVKNSVV